MKTLAIKDIVKTIEEYRRAFWAHKYPDFLVKARYSPLVTYDLNGEKNPTHCVHNFLYKVRLFDTWVYADNYSRMHISKNLVTFYKSDHLQLALEQLLDYTRLQFIDEKLFQKI